MPGRSHESLDPAEEAKHFGEGVRLFNAGDFFEAHEAWEEAWHMATGRRRRFYQGLIQAAVALEHLRRGNRRGCTRLYQGCLAKLDDLPDVYRGIEIMPLLVALHGALAHMLDDPQAPVVPDPARFFAIDLRYDPFVTPRATDVP